MVVLGALLVVSGGGVVVDGGVDFVVDVWLGGSLRPLVVVVPPVDVPGGGVPGGSGVPGGM